MVVVFNIKPFFHKFFSFQGTINQPEDTSEHEETALDISTRFQNEEMVASIVDAFKRGTVGEGILVLMESDDEIFNQHAQKMLKKTDKKRYHEITRRMSHRMAQRECVSNEKTRGGIIVRHHFRDDWKYQYKTEYISVDRIDTTYNSDGYQNGIKKDKWGEITYIRIYTDNTKSNSKDISYKHLTLYMTPWDSIHRYSPLSPLKPTLTGVAGLQEYATYEIKTAKNNSDRSIIVETAAYAALQEAAEKVLRNERKKGTVEYKEAQAFMNGVMIKSVSGVQHLPKGDIPHNMNIMNNTNFKELTEGGKKNISAAVGLSAAEAFGDNIMRYTDGLLGQNKSERSFEIDFDNLWDGLLEEIYINKLKGLANKGLLMKDDGNGNPIPLTPAEFYRNIDDYTEMSPYRMTTAHLDPEKTEKATAKAIENGTTTLKDEIGKRGADYRVQLKQTIYEKVLAEKIENEIRKELKAPKDENEN